MATLPQLHHWVSVVGAQRVGDAGNSRLRRLAWLALLLFGVAFLCFHVYKRVSFYATSPTFTKVSLGLSDAAVGALTRAGVRVERDRVREA